MNFKNKELESLVNALTEAKGTFLKKKKGNVWGGIVASLANVYPEDSKALAVAFGSASIEKKQERRYKNKAVNVSPDSEGYDPLCPTCGGHGSVDYDQAEKAANNSQKVLKNQKLDDDDPMNTKVEEVAPNSLSTAKEIMDVKNYFGGDVEKAKEYLKATGVTVKSNWKEKTIWDRILNDILNK